MQLRQPQRTAPCLPTRLPVRGWPGWPAAACAAVARPAECGGGLRCFLFWPALTSAAGPSSLFPCGAVVDREAEERLLRVLSERAAKFEREQREVGGSSRLLLRCCARRRMRRALALPLPRPAFSCPAQRSCRPSFYHTAFGPFNTWLQLAWVNCCYLTPCRPIGWPCRRRRAWGAGGAAPAGGRCSTMRIRGPRATALGRERARVGAQSGLKELFSGPVRGLALRRRHMAPGLLLAAPCLLPCHAAVLPWKPHCGARLLPPCVHQQASPAPACPPDSSMHAVGVTEASTPPRTLHVQMPRSGGWRRRPARLPSGGGCGRMTTTTP